MRNVGIVSFAQSNARAEVRNEVEFLLPVVKEAVARSGMERTDIEFTCSGSSDFLQGQPFAFVLALDGVGAWPPIKESHVEMDGAFALYEAWVKIQTGEVDSAIIYSFGKTSPGDLAEVVALQLDPYCVTQLWPDADSVAGIQARLFLERSGKSERDLAEIAARSRRDAQDNPHAVTKGDFDVEKLLAEPYRTSPLRDHDCPTNTDGATVMVIAAEEKARELSKRPVWIRGIDHRIDPPALGVRDLTSAPSAELAASKAGVGSDKVDFAELDAPYTHQELILREALGLADDLRVNPSGGSLCSRTLFSCGLNRIGDAFERIAAGDGDRAVAHATQGHCLQQNLVCVLEGE
ncbi:MAG: thiolase domain-containing protein [Myxococcota bacterium]